MTISNALAFVFIAAIVSWFSLAMFCMSITEDCWHGARTQACLDKLD